MGMDAVQLNGIKAEIESHKAAARANGDLVDECMDFADTFGGDSAYMGWAWTMNPTAAQNWTSEFLNNLKGGNTVQQAHAEFISAHPGEDNDSRLMKIYGATENLLDKNLTGGVE